VYLDHEMMLEQRSGFGYSPIKRRDDRVNKYRDCATGWMWRTECSRHAQSTGDAL